MADAVIRKPGFGAAALTFLLSLLLPPAGYLYIGHARRGLAQLAVLLGLIALPAFGPAALFQSAAGLAAYVALGVIALLAFLADSVRLLLMGRARRGLPYQRWWVYAAVVAGWFGYGFADDALKQADLKTVRSYRAPSSSSLPTLRTGEAFIATRLSDPLRRGDLVLYRVANDARVGRVMALGGDRIAMRNGAVVLNGVELKREAAPPFVSPAGEGMPARELPAFRETNAEGRSYLTLDLNENGFLDNADEVEVPAGHVFLMGDNRDNSLDSRAPGAVGFVPEANVPRRVGLIYWSRDSDRIGTVVE
ncbi:hypothetical protein GCM10008171_02600 [Methylopila jiangsuensis]|uniref:Signal peptidase I n=1 Tax=Methylopila jiangsuensis TaxID=586230 RepID=A0A9W6JEL2_9HYPH|nr:signal peptidase I [Methylopila jiangsuensis]MDR6287425.1 signal peptidase I [Methylopila jiangsuensis]GLK75006.1 hypothetical protein GCM10008171_02600 [Methylopila jiangsuensis]